MGWAALPPEPLRKVHPASSSLWGASGVLGFCPHSSTCTSTTTRHLSSKMKIKKVPKQVRALYYFPQSSASEPRAQAPSMPNQCTCAPEDPATPPAAAEAHRPSWAERRARSATVPTCSWVGWAPSAVTGARAMRGRGVTPPGSPHASPASSRCWPQLGVGLCRLPHWPRTDLWSLSTEGEAGEKPASHQTTLSHWENYY